MRPTLAEDDFLDALTNLFRAEGVSRLTVGEIAARLRCSRRRLYEIAQTKEEIFCTVVDRHLRGLLDEGEAVIRVEQDLIAALIAYLDVGVRGSSIVSAEFARDMEHSDQARASFDAYQRARASGISQLIDRGVRAGVLVECHGPLVAELLLGGALRVRQPEFLARVGLTMEEAFREFYRVVLSGLLVEKTASLPPPKVSRSAANRPPLPGPRHPQEDRPMRERQRKNSEAQRRISMS